MRQWHEIHDVLLLETYRQIPGRILAGERWFAERGEAGELVLKTTAQFRTPQLESSFLTLNLYEFTAISGFFYYLPLLITSAALEGQIAYFQRGAYYFYDGIATAAYLELLSQLLTRQCSVPGLPGDSEFKFQITADFMTPRFQPNNSSSNSLLFVSQQYLVKNYRRIYPGINPELRLGLALTEAHAECAPLIWGSISCCLDHNTECTLGLLQEMVEHQGTGWAVWGCLLTEPTATHRDELVRQAVELGRTLADLHRELARIAAQSNQLIPFEGHLLQERISRFTATVRSELTMVDPALADRIDHKITQISSGVVTAGSLGKLFHIHGDLHLEQVLKTATGWKVIDFEGEPLKTIVEREYYDSPLKDVASVLRSIGYRVNTAVSGMTGYEALLHEALVNGYHDRYREYQGDFLPDDANFDRLLDLFQLERVIYELSYEAKYRPDWLHIPLSGLMKLVETGGLQ